MENLLSINNLNFKCSNNIIFKDLTFNIRRNTCNAVLGCNNSGKTTLVRIITGILQSNNCISVDNVMLNKKNLKEYSLLIGSFLAKDNINFLFEDILSELVFSLENLCYSRKAIEKRLEYMINTFKLETLINKKISELTNFEKIKIGVVAALMHEPKLLLLDDAFDNLEYSEYLEIMKLLKKYMKNSDLTILYTTINLDCCLKADNILLMENKRISLYGDINKFLEKDNMLSRIGINISTMLDMSLKLKFYGLTDKILKNPKEMVDELWKN